MLVISTSKLYEGHWETAVFEGKIKNFNDNGEVDDQMTFVVDWDEPLESFGFDNGDAATEQHLELIRSLPKKQINNNKFELDYIN